MVECRDGAHAVYDAKHHDKVLQGRVAERARDAAIVRAAASLDHTRMLLPAPPHLSPAKLVQYLTRHSRNQKG